MLVDITSVAHAVQYAQKIARKMSKDPEVDSVAGDAAWRALYTYRIEKGVKLSWWIAELTKQGVIHYWRQLQALRRKEQLHSEKWWAEQALKQPADQELDVSKEDWQLLVESFVLEWPLDVIARERNIPIDEARAKRKAALSRLEAAV